MRFKIMPLEERVVLDASGIHTLFSVNDIQHQSAEASEIDLGDISFDGEATVSDSGVHLLVISSEVPHPESLLRSVQSDVQVVYYNATSTTLSELSENINETLAGNRASSIGFISHGSDGNLRIASDGDISLESLHEEHQRVFWHEIGTYVEEEGRIDLMGCNIGSSFNGEALISALESLADTSVAASDDATGHLSLGGDWILERGGIDASLEYFRADLLPSWQHTLATPLASAPQAGQALAFDGIDDDVVISDAPTLSASSSFTVEAWIFVEADDTVAHTVVSKGASDATCNYALDVVGHASDNTFKVTLGYATDSGEKTLETGYDGAKGEWVHIAAVVDTASGGMHALYINGSSEASASSLGFSSIVTNSDDVHIGGGDTPFAGALDEIRLWSSARASGDIAAEYSSVLSGDETGLVGFWRLDEGSGSTAHDFSGSGNHGTLSGTSANSASIALSSFDTGRMGWETVREDGTAGVTFEMASGGVSGGYISTYNMASSPLYWNAGSLFTGDLLTAYDGTLSFSMKQSATTNTLDATNDILLEGEDITLSYNISDPDVDWTDYNISLNESGWVDADSGDAATQGNMYSVLASMMSLKIRAEYLSDFAVSDLDNVEVFAAGTPIPAWIASSVPFPEAFSTAEDSDLVITLSGVDADGDTLSAKITTLPSDGTLFQYDGTGASTPITVIDTVVSHTDRKVVFRPDAEEHGELYSTFGFSVADDTTTSLEAFAAITVTSVNDAPTVTTNEGVTLDEGASAIIGDTLLSASDDNDSAFVTTYTVTALPDHGVLYRLDAELSVGSSFTQADIDRDRISYEHDDSETSSDSFDFTVEDSENATTEELTFSISVNRVNDAPPSSGGAVTLVDTSDEAVSIAEDTLVPSSANVRLAIPLLSDTDGVAPTHIRILSISEGELAQGDGSSITLGSSGTLLALTDGHYDLRFTPEGNSDVDATFEYVVVDPDDSAMNSEASTATISVTPVNDTPVLTSTLESTTVDYAENDGFVPVDPSLTLSDIDLDTVTSATVSIISGYKSHEDALIVTSLYDLTATFNSSTGVLSISGEASLEQYQEVLRSVAYVNRSENPTEATRSFSISFSDGTASSGYTARDIAVTAEDDSPIATGSGPGRSVVFDGLDDVILISGESTFDVTDALTAEMWVRFNTAADAGTERTVIAKGAAWHLTSDPDVNTVSFVTPGLTDVTLTSSEAVADGDWHHIAAVFDGTTKYIYIDGTLDVSEASSGTLAANDDEVSLGADLAAGDNNFAGALDEVRIWDTARSGDDIEAGYDKILVGDETGLIGYWRFDEVDGIISEDLSTNDNHALLGDTTHSSNIIVASLFESGTEGWKVTKSGGLTTDPTLQTTGGHGGGYISLTNPDPIWSYWQAPEKFLGDMSAAYGGILHVSLRDQGTGSAVNQPDIILEGNSTTLTYSFDGSPDTTSWTEYDIPLHEDAGWVNAATGNIAMRAEVEGVLGDLTTLKIRAEHLTGDDTFHLDSVFIASDDVPYWLDSEAGISGVITVNEDSDTDIALPGSDTDQSPLQATISYLTGLLNGSRLFQMLSGGGRGSQISLSNTVVSSPFLSVLFGAGNSGSSSFGYNVSDGDSDSDDGTINVDVIAVNDAPVITMPSEPTVNEDATLSITGLIINDEDVNETDNASLRLDLSVNDGILSLSTTSGLLFSAGDGYADAAMTFTGSLDAINAAIDGMTYRGDANFYGEDTLTVTINDRGNTGEGDALEDTETLTITVENINDAPVVTPGSQGDIFEDQEGALADVTITDSTDPSSTLTATLSVSHGTLAADGETSADTLTFEGTPAELTTLIGAVTYTSDENYVGSDTLSISVADGDLDPVTASVSLDVLATNDAPVLAVADDVSGNEDATIAIGATTFADLDVAADALNLFEISLAVDDGTFSLAQTARLTFSSGDGVDDTAMVFQGNITDITAALASMSFRAPANDHGEYTLSVDVDDLGNVGQGDTISDDGAITVTVNALDDPYTLTNPDSITVDEGTKTLLTGLIVNDLEVDEGEVLNTAVSVKVVLTVSHGTLSSTEGEAGNATMSLSGSLAEVNASLASIYYEGEELYQGTDILAVEVRDFSDNALITEGETSLALSAINDAPTVTVPVAQEATEDIALGITGISVADPDINESILANAKVTLSVDHGTISLAQTTNLSFDADNGTAEVIFTGNLEDLNTALATVTYLSDSNYNGDDVLTITINDLGNTGEGGAKSDTETIAITVLPDNDAPVLTLPDTQEAQEDVELAIDGITVADLDFEDTASPEMTVTLTARDGTISFGDDFAKELTFTASSLSDANTKLDTLAYKGAENAHADDVISITVNDMGYSDISDEQGAIDATGAKEVTQQLAVSITAVNDAPEITSAPTTFSAEEDTATDFSGIVVADLDLAENLDAYMTVTLELLAGDGPGHGSLSLDTQSGLIVLDDDGDKSVSFRGSTSAINTALDSLSYQGDTNYHGSDSLAVTINDEGNSGSGGAKTATVTIPITVSNVNDAPTLIEGEYTLDGINEDITGSDGTLLADMIGEGITDIDDSALEGIAVTVQDTTNGSWEYTVDDTNWESFGTISEGSALHLSVDTATKVRFVPSQDFNGDATFTFRAWDKTNELSTGTTAAIAATGGITPYSDVTDTAAIAVSPVNDAPVMDGADSPMLPDVAEDATDPEGVAIATLLDGLITDVDVNALQGLALTAVDASNGTWEYSLNGGEAWSDVGVLSTENALLLSNDAMTRIRFVPNAEYNGEIDLSFQAWDRTDGTEGNKVSLSAAGGTSAFSLVTHTAPLTITPVNDAPTLTGGDDLALTAIIEDAPSIDGDLITTLVDGFIGDIDAGALKGIAITAADVTNGSWQYYDADISNWSPIASFASPIPDGEAFLVKSDATTKIRFVPSGNYNGDAFLTFHAWDQSSGEAGTSISISETGDTTPFSTASRRMAVNVVAINDAPVLDNSGTFALPTFAEDPENNAGIDIATLLGDTVTDEDSGAVEGIALISADMDNGTWQFTLDGGSTWTDIEETLTSDHALHLAADGSTSLRFVPNEHYNTDNGLVYMSFRSWDQAFNRSNGSYDGVTLSATAPYSADSDTASLEVTAVNDAPLITLPEAQTAQEDGSIDIEGISLFDGDTVIDDTIVLQVTVSVEHGLMDLAQTTDLLFTTGNGNDDSTMTFKGTLADLNAALATISYTPDGEYNGSDAISVTVNDLANSGATDSGVEDLGIVINDDGEYINEDSLDLTVTAVNDPVEIIMPSPLTVAEDTELAIDSIALSDIDSGLVPDMEVEVTLAVVHGTISVDLTAGDVEVTQGTGSGDVTMKLCGTIPEVNDVIATLTYLGNENYNEETGAGAETLTIAVDDLGNVGIVSFGEGPPTDVTIAEDHLITTKTVAITVTSVNDAPIMTAPEELFTTNEDTAIAIPGISIADIDIAEDIDGNIEVTLTAAHGVMTLAAEQRAALTFSAGDGEGDDAMIFSGNLVEVNAALATLVYNPDGNYNSDIDGDDIINIAVDDLGVNGSGTALTDEKTVDIHITAINDAPTDIDFSGSISQGDITNFTVIGSFDTADVDIVDDDLHQYTLLDDSGGTFVLHENQLHMANEALQTFADDPYKELVVISEDPDGDSVQQHYVFSDRDIPTENYTAETKFFSSASLANAAKNLQYLSSVSGSMNYFNTLGMSNDPDGTGAQALEDATNALEGTTTTTTYNPYSQFSGFLRLRSTSYGGLF
jgi:hypothetical protein